MRKSYPDTFKKRNLLNAVSKKSRAADLGIRGMIHRALTLPALGDTVRYNFLVDNKRAVYMPPGQTLGSFSWKR